MKKIIAIVIMLAVAAGIGLTLRNNKMKADEKIKASQITITSVSVKIDTVGTQLVTDDLVFTGTITPHNEVTVSSETMGQVKGIGFDVGSHVGRGTMLARVDDELKVAGVQLAQSNLEKARKDAWRIDTLAQQNIMPQMQNDAATLGLKAAQAQYTIALRQLRDTRITSPVSGVVTMKFISVGSSVAPGTPIATIVDVTRLKVRVNVSEGDAFKLKAGDRVQVTTDVYPGVEFPGYIRTISAKGDEGHTYPVEIELANNGANPLKAGMFAKVAFRSIGSKAVLTVPREALTGSIKDPKVFVVDGRNARLRSITVDGEAGTSVIVRQGLISGDRVVVSGQNNLKDGAEVKIVQ